MSIADIATMEWLKASYLAGVKTTDANGVEFDDAIYQTALDSAISIAEAELDIVLRGNQNFKYAEEHDSEGNMNRTWYLLLLDKRPVRRITKFQIRLGSHPPTTIPADWVHISSAIAGQIQIIPGPSSLGQISLAGGYLFYGPSIGSTYSYVPLWFHVEYTAGFEVDIAGTASVEADSVVISMTGNTDLREILRVRDYVRVGDEMLRVTAVHENDFETASEWESDDSGLVVTHYAYDPAILNYIGLTAAIPALAAAGDLILGSPGITGTSLGMDGFSQSFSGQPTFKNKIDIYTKMADKQMEIIRRKYSQHNMMVL